MRQTHGFSSLGHSPDLFVCSCIIRNSDSFCARVYCTGALKFNIISDCSSVSLLRKRAFSRDSEREREAWSDVVYHECSELCSVWLLRY